MEKTRGNFFQSDGFEMKEEEFSKKSIPLLFCHSVTELCIGRRMAEAMIYSLVSQILCTYRLEYADEFDIGVDLSMRERMLLKPARPVSLKFIPRQ